MAYGKLDDYLVQQILSRLILPFDHWPAFALGIIDRNGKVLKKRTQLRTQAEKEAWGYIDILCCNLRKILSDYPTTRMKLAQLNMIQNAPLPTTIGQPPTIPLSTLASTFFLLKDHVEDIENLPKLKEQFERFIDEQLKITGNKVEGGHRYDIEYEKHPGSGIVHKARVAVLPDILDKTRGTVAAFSDSYPQSFGTAIARAVSRYIKKDSGVKIFHGGRVSGAGRGRHQSVTVKEDFKVNDKGKYVEVFVHDHENKRPVVGYGRFLKGSNNRVKGDHAEFVTVNKDYRGKGIANKMYDAVEKVLGRKLVPSHTQSDDAKRLWKRRGVSEDVAVNSVGGGAIAGVGVGPDGLPPVKKRKTTASRLMRRRALQNGFN